MSKAHLTNTKQRENLNLQQLFLSLVFHEKLERYQHFVLMS